MVLYISTNSWVRSIAVPVCGEMHLQDRIKEVVAPVLYFLDHCVQLTPHLYRSLPHLNGEFQRFADHREEGCYGMAPTGFNMHANERHRRCMPRSANA